MFPGLVDKIMDYESGNMSDRDVVAFFGELIKSGVVWELQGSYGRQAVAFIESGIIDRKGDVDWERFDELTE
jgi:hypothetical protein